MESIEYLGRQLPLLGHYDTVVVGGGAAGAAVLPGAGAAPHGGGAHRYPIVTMR